MGIKDIRKIILASNNKHKIEEIKSIFKNFPYEIISLKEAGIDIDVIEDGETFEENAYKKAKEIMDVSGEATLADDSGLEVFALDGKPGVYSARFGGEHGNDRKNNLKLLELLKNTPEEERGAQFVSVIVLLTPGRDKIVARGEVKGVIGYEEKGENGFGYDPLFIIPELNKTFAELIAEEKNSISHRARALDVLKNKLESMY